MIRRSAPIPSSQDLRDRLAGLVALGFDHTLENSNDEVALHWVGGWSMRRVYEQLGSPRGWQLVGDSDLVGRYRIGDERAKSAIRCHRVLNQGHLGEIVVRHLVSAGHRYDHNQPGDDTDLFELLVAFDEEENFPIPKSIAAHLLTWMSTECTDTEPYHPSDHAHQEELQRLSRCLGVVGYDTLWAKAYSELQ